jgi:hypothetical protein
MPKWVKNEDIWKKAKSKVDRDKYNDEVYWKIVTDVYKKMGGEIKENLNYLERIRNLKERLEDKTPQQRVNLAWDLFKKIMSQTENLSEPPKFIGDDRDSLLGNIGLLGFGAQFNFNNEYNDEMFGFYEAENELKKQIEKFKKEVKKILKIKWKNNKTKFTHNYFQGTITTFTLLGTAFFKEYIAYLKDFNTGKNIILGRYKNRHDAEMDELGLYGFSQIFVWRENEKPHIYYWKKNGKKTEILKEFDNNEEMRKYVDNLEIVIEEVDL